MRYNVRVAKRVRYVRVYSITKRIGHTPNLLTRLFIRAFAKKREAEGLQA